MLHVPYADTDGSMTVVNTTISATDMMTLMSFSDISIPLELNGRFSIRKSFRSRLRKVKLLVK